MFKFTSRGSDVSAVTGHHVKNLARVGCLGILLGCGAAVPAHDEASPTVGHTQLERLRQNAEAGDAHAQLGLGEHHARCGDSRAATMWYRRAADQGLAEAQLALAACYANGWGVEKNLEEAARWSEFANLQLARQLRQPAPPTLPPLPPELSVKTNAPGSSAQVPAPAAAPLPPRARRVHRVAAVAPPPSRLEPIVTAIPPGFPHP